MASQAAFDQLLAGPQSTPPKTPDHNIAATRTLDAVVKLSHDVETFVKGGKDTVERLEEKYDALSRKVELLAHKLYDSKAVNAEKLQTMELSNTKKLRDLELLNIALQQKVADLEKQRKQQQQQQQPAMALVAARGVISCNADHCNIHEHCRARMMMTVKERARFNNARNMREKRAAAKLHAKAHLDNLCKGLC